MSKGHDPSEWGFALIARKNGDRIESRLERFKIEDAVRKEIRLHGPWKSAEFDFDQGSVGFSVEYIFGDPDSLAFLRELDAMSVYLSECRREVPYRSVPLLLDDMRAARQAEIGSLSEIRISDQDRHKKERLIAFMQTLRLMKAERGLLDVLYRSFHALRSFEARHPQV